MRGGRGRGRTGRRLGGARGQAHFVQAILPGLLQAPYFDAGGQQFGNVQNTMGLRRFAPRPRQLFLVRPEIQRARQFPHPLHQFGQMQGGGGAGIGHVVNAKGRADFPQVKTGAHTILRVGQGINGVARMGLALELPQETARVLPLAEGQPGPPDITLPNVPDRLLRQRLGPAVKSAGRTAETEVRLVQLVKPGD